MTFTVRILARAQQDVAVCYSYLADRSPQGAANWFNRFSEARTQLAQNPEKRPLAPESAHLMYEVREALFRTRKGRHYRILFTIRGSEVLVLRVRGPGQDYLGPG